MCAIISLFEPLRQTQWERESPGRTDQNARALGDILLTQLSDPKLFDFLGLGRETGAALPDAHVWLTGEPHHCRSDSDD